jgi:hypothetical protein
MAWRVARLDDNGNKFIVAQFDSREEAENRLSQFETKEGHKQTYWVEETPFKGEMETIRLKQRGLFAKETEEANIKGKTIEEKNKKENKAFH